MIATDAHTKNRKLKQVRYKFTCVCGLTSVDDTAEPFKHYTHEEMLKIGYKYRRWADGTWYYLSHTHAETCECYS